NCLVSSFYLSSFIFLVFRSFSLLLFSQTTTSDFFFFFFNDTPTTEIYTLSLHDALPISLSLPRRVSTQAIFFPSGEMAVCSNVRSEEHTSELQSRGQLVCRLLLEKKNSEISLSSNITIL